MLRGPLIFRRITDDDFGCHWTPDSHRDPVFFWLAQMIRGAPTALTCFFVGFRTDFVTSVRVLAVSMEFWP